MAEKEIVKASQPFGFSTCLIVSELTGLKARDLEELARLIQEVPESSIYHHTHRFLQQHQYLSPEPPNDFAYWVTDVLGEDDLGEKLASIDIIQFSNLDDLRARILSTITDHMKETGGAGKRSARRGEEFYFLKSVSFILPTKYAANDLKEFADILQAVSIDSIYFHMFDARLRLKKDTNDFSNWIETSIGDKKLAGDIAKLDPYTYTMHDLRKTIIRLVQKRIGS